MIHRILVLLCFFITLQVGATPLLWKTFTNGKYTWICGQSSVSVFSSDTRSVYPVQLDQTITVNRVVDVVQSENYLLFSTDAGIYQLDMSNQSIERITFEQDVKRTGVLAVDMDYLWIAALDTLFRYDKLGGEWSFFPLPEKMNVRSLKSDGEKVECLGVSKSCIFTISSEKWNTFLFSNTLSDSVKIYSGLSSKIAIYDKSLNVYNSVTYQWEQYQSAESVHDVTADDTVLFYASGSQAIRVSRGVQRKVAIPDNGIIKALEKKADSLFLLYDTRILKFTLKTGQVSFIDVPSELSTKTPEKMIVNNSFIVIVFEEQAAIYDQETNNWTIAQNSSKKSLTRVSWGEEGPVIRYTPGVQTNIRGFIESATSIKSGGYEYDSTVTYQSRYKKDDQGAILYDSLNHAILETDSTVKIDSVLLMKWVRPDVVADINIHTSGLNGRTLDITFDNTNSLIPPEKNIVYKGSKTDILNTLRAGTNQTDLLQSQLHTPVRYEGGQMIIESKSKLSGKDRKIARLSGGTGFVTSRSHWRVLNYSHDGIYYLSGKNDNVSTFSSTDTTDNRIDGLQSNDTTQILPGSLVVWVDGSRLDSAYYTFFSTTATLKIDAAAPVDPVSLITISYKVQPVPERGNEQVEFQPRYDFGQLYYGTATVSLLDWMSLRAGIESHENLDFKPVVNTAVPLELRRDAPDLLFKITPEFSLHTGNGNKAAALDVQSRIGKKLEVSFNGLLADDAYSTTDTFTLGYGAIKSKYDIGVHYDILPEIPFHYSQHRFASLYGNEQNYHFSTGVYFPRYPLFNVEISRTVLDDSDNDSVAVFDSLFHTKDRIVLKLFETHSPQLEQLLHFKKIAYEFVHTEYRYNDTIDGDFYNGRRSDVKVLLLPVHSVTINNRLTYKHGVLGNGMSSSLAPSTEFITSDFPPGVDIQGLYRFTAMSFSMRDSSANGIERSLGLTLRPAQWIQPLRWMSLNGMVSQQIQSTLDHADPEFIEYVNGTSDNNTVLTKSIGVNLFPNQVFYLRNKNQWTDQDSGSSFTSTNDIDVLFDSRNIWKNSISYFTKGNSDKIDGSTKYIFKVNSWFQLAPEFTGHYQADTAGHVTSYGPQLSTGIVFNNWRFLKNLFNDQSVSLMWHRKNSSLNSFPDFSYFFRLDVVVLPNIKLSNQETITFSDGNFDTFTGNLNITVLF